MVTVIKLKRKLPSATLFLLAVPFTAAKNNFNVVPISAPNTMAIAISKVIALANNAVKVRAIIAELD